MIAKSKDKIIAVSKTGLKENAKPTLQSVAVASVNSIQQQSKRAGRDKLPLQEINAAIACVRSKQKVCRLA